MSSKKVELTIHKWHDDFLKIKLDNYILSFDDGLHSQVEGIKKIIKIYPNITIHFYVTTSFINYSSSKPTYNESDIAQDLAINWSNFSDFVTYDELLYLSHLPQVTIGFHGHKHLKPSMIKRNKSLSDYFEIMSKDHQLMIFTLINFYENCLIKKGEPILYCTPYNEYEPLIIANLRKQFAMYFKEELIVTGPDRLDILDFDEAPSMSERYDAFLSKKQKEMISLMRVPPKYFSEVI